MVKKVFIDTNVWLRFILKDEKEQFVWSKKLIEQIEEGRFKPYTSAIVFLEINFVLAKLYKITFSKIDKIIKGILATRNLIVVDKTDFKKTFVWHKKYKIKLSDCLIASSLPKGCCLITWDRELKKIKLLQVCSPQQLMNAADPLKKN